MLRKRYWQKVFKELTISETQIYEYDMTDISFIVFTYYTKKNII